MNKEKTILSILNDREKSQVYVNESILRKRGNDSDGIHYLTQAATALGAAIIYYE